MKKSKTKIFWISIAIGCLIVFTLMLLSSVINIGERLRKLHVSVEIAFYVLVFLIVFLVIINPIRIILTSPHLIRHRLLLFPLPMMELLRFGRLLLPDNLTHNF